MGSLKNFIVTGNPGVGKTTLIKECVLPFKEKFSGFYTEELREGKDRVGFMLKTLSGESGILAQKGMSSKTKLNKYGVDLSVLEKIGLQSIQDGIENNKMILLDEIGSMEMLSPLFCEKVPQVFGGPQFLLATIRLKAEPFTSQIKKMSDTKLVHLTKENFVDLKQEIRHWIEDH